MESLQKSAPPDDEERRLRAELDECARQLAIAKNALKNPSHSMLMDEYRKIESAIKAKSLKCEDDLATLRAHRRARTRGELER